MTSMDYYRGCLEPSSSSSSLSSLRISHNHAVDAVGNQPRILLIDSYCYYYYKTEWNGENEFAVSKFNKGNAKYYCFCVAVTSHSCSHSLDAIFFEIRMNAIFNFNKDFYNLLQPISARRARGEKKMRRSIRINLK